MQNLWNFLGKEQEFQSLIKKKKCLFFYPYNRKGNKSFDGCEKEREALIAKNRFTITNLLVILGIIATILLSGLQTCSNKQNTLSQQNVSVVDSQPKESDKK